MPGMSTSCLARRRAPRGKVLAVKWGYNPNSSSLGVDITFLLFGLSIITLLTPLVGFLLRWYRAEAAPPPAPGPLGSVAPAPGPQ
ncbi:MAG TPA: hypothetical protein PLW65_07910 [Pseudomonadota bacterium]|nr:hypothetical protein [Pseudomonadota bacterium]